MSRLTAARLAALALLFAAAALGCGARAQTSLIANGGFEQFNSDTTLPAAWQRQISDTEAMQFGAFPAAPTACCIAFQTTQPLSGAASLFASQSGPSNGAVWQPFTLPAVPLLSLTVRLTYGAQIGGTTPADRVQIAIANADALAADPSQAIRVLATLDGAAGPVSTQVSTLVVKLTAADIAALGRQPLALSFFTDAETFPALLIADDVSITVQLAAFGTTPNQIAASAAAIASGSAVLAAAVTTLAGLDGPRQDIALNHLGAPIYGDMLGAGLDRQRSFGAMLSNLLTARRRGIGLPMDGGADTVTRGRVSTWAAAIGSAARFATGGNTGASTTDLGVAMGADTMLTDTLRSGVALAFVNGRTTARDTGGSSTGNTVMLGLYGGWSQGNVFLDGQAIGSYSDQTVHRDLGAFGGRVTGRVRGPGVSGGLEAGWRGDVAGFTIQPSAMLRVDTVSRGRVTENGNPLALGVSSGGATSSRAGAGLRVSRGIELGGTTLGITARLGFAYEMSDPRIRTNLAFLDDGTAFGVVNAKSGREIGQFDLGLTLPVTPGIDAFATYATEIRRNYAGQGATAGVRIAF